MDQVFGFIISQPKPLEDFESIENLDTYQNVGVIDKDLTEEKIFVCFVVGRKQKFFLASSYQVPIIEKICESSDKDIPYEERTSFGLVQARGFKYILPRSGRGGIPVIGYTNKDDQKVYAIPMIFYGSSGNGMISRFEEGEEGEYLLYDKEEKLIDSWPLSD